MIRQFYIEPVYNRFYYVLLTIYETIDEIIVILLVGEKGKYSFKKPLRNNFF